MSCSEQLTTALEKLDRAFAQEEPFPVTGCTYCYGDRDFALLSGPLDLVDDDLVTSVAAEVPDHWGDFPRLYRRLTPRIVRRLVTGQLHVDEELVASRLVQADWTTWDAPLVEALRDVWSAWWESTLRTPSSPVPVTKTLAVVTVTTGGMRPWLDTWAATRTPAADEQLAYLVDDVMFEVDVTDLRMGFYDDYEASAELLPWLLTDVRDRVSDARLDDPLIHEYLRTAARHPG
ncbi:MULTISPECIES: hypothetical protein [unclassified Streptomyces]|uniref:hypothetical protein n=1 Tax=unclassified Streptomyces TaxID=2593676 RepID=UPI0006AF2C33|nr:MULTISPECIES: hypothetical protein [unclassified Streptomyces]KOX27694.1 hypothetical protein ADL06_14455 [Streptomyces sp. NRRL F-6491]KOX36295.1 hypothetical protein ADL08_32635 [Streptomyces sp. NRRL F-6492]